MTYPLLQGRNCSSARDHRCKDVPFHCNTERERDDIQEEEVLDVSRLSLARQDTGLHGRTVRHSLIGVDALLQLLAVEEIAEELLYPGNTGAATNQHNLVDLALLDVRILQDLLDRLDRAGEGLAVDVFETRTGDGGIEVLTVVEGIDLDRGLSGVGQSSLRTLAGSTQTTKGARVVGDV